MKAIIDFKEDGSIIISYGIEYNKSIYDGLTVDIPDDYNPEFYDYIPAVPGIFDPNGFVRKSVEKEENI